MANDTGTSTFVGAASDESAPSTISLAEVSSRYKAEKGTRNAKVLSNEDVQTMLNNKSGVTMARNMPPLGSGALEQGAQATQSERSRVSLSRMRRRMLQRISRDKMPPQAREEHLHQLTMA